MSTESSQKTKKKLVMLDFDGVLMDTLPLWYSLTQVTNPNMSFEEYARMAHGNFYDSFQSEKPTVAFVPYPEAREIYHNELLATFTVSEHIKNTVLSLSVHYHLVIVSSSSEHTIRAFFEKENMHELFDHILGFETHKSKTVKFNHLLETYAIESSETIFVTDTLGDVHEAHAAGIRSIGVTWGLHTTEVLQEGKPHAIINEREELMESIITALEN